VETDINVPIGSATFGHYWIYIYDFQGKIFRKYNDGYVTEVKDEREVFMHDENNPPTPYFLGKFSLSEARGRGGE